MASEDYLVDGEINFEEDPTQLHSHRQPSITAVLDDEEHGPKRRTIQASNGKRRRRSAKQVKAQPKDTDASAAVAKMEHTFGDGKISIDFT